jgi:hypothetical protein
MKKVLTLAIVLSAFIGNAQRTMFHAQNKYVGPVLPAAPVLGATYGGGKIFYIFQPGDPGYVAGESHGLIAAPSDIPYGTYKIFPSCYASYGTSIALSTGAENTTKKIQACTADNQYWFSSELYAWTYSSYDNAWYQFFTDGSQSTTGKGYFKGVRAIRTF